MKELVGLFTHDYYWSEHVNEYIWWEISDDPPDGWVARASEDQKKDKYEPNHQMPSNWEIITGREP